MSALNTIVLSIENGHWMAKHSDPEVFDAFGTDTLPTAWTEKMGPRKVLTFIQDLNPSCIVSLK